MLEAGISFDWVTSKDLRESHWDAFYDFYMETGVAEMGLALPDAEVLQPDQREHGCACAARFWRGARGALLPGR